MNKNDKKMYLIISLASIVPIATLSYFVNPLILIVYPIGQAIFWFIQSRKKKV